MITRSAVNNICRVAECGMILPFFLKTIFFNLRILVRLLSSGYFVTRYSHDRIAKNNAMTRRFVTAKSQGVSERLCIFLNTEAGRAFCLFFTLSSFLYPRYCSCKRKHVLPSASNWGSSLAFDRKACDTYETVELTVPSTKTSLFCREKEASRTA